MEQCRVCGSTALSQPIPVRDMMFGSREVFDYMRCADCGTLQIADIPEDLSRYYGNATYYSFRNAVKESPHKALLKKLVAASIVGRPDRYPRGEGLMDRMRRGVEPWIALVPGLTRDSSILDVGCGEGARLHNLAAMGFTHLTGVDPFLAEESAGIQPDGVRLVRAPLAAIDGTYDLVVMHHSLEHFEDPGQQMEIARALVAPGGYLMVRIPILQEELWEEYGANWVQIDAPRHLYLFTMPGFTAFAERHGYRCEAQGTDGLGWCLAWSELYARDLPMFQPDGTPNPSPFSAAEMQAFERRAWALNRQGRGDSAWFLLKPA